MNPTVGFDISDFAMKFGAPLLISLILLFGVMKKLDRLADAINKMSGILLGISKPSLLEEDKKD